jgi:hypothetical protein
MKTLHARTLPIVLLLLASCSGYTEAPSCRGELFSLNAEEPVQRLAGAAAAMPDQPGERGR